MLAAVAAMTVVVSGTAALAQIAAAEATAPQLGYGVRQILQLAQAKIGDETILAFIKNSGNSYGLNADQIIYLRQQGLSDAIVTAMLNQPRAGAALPLPATSAPPPVVSTATPAPHVAYEQAAPETTYYSGPYYYYDPYYYSPGYTWYSPVALGWGWGWGWGGRGYYRGYHGYAGFRGGWHGGGFAGGFHAGGFHGGGVGGGGHSGGFGGGHGGGHR